jgi:hypothetical protein
MTANAVTAVAWLGAGLFLGILILLEAGRRVGAWQMKRVGAGAHEGTGSLAGSVFALLGLLVAFTFAGAGSRFDARRQLVVQEANAIGTAYLRLDLLPAAARPALQDRFRRYLDSRLEAYRLIPDYDAAHGALWRSAALQREIWAEATGACGHPDAAADACRLLLPPLNEMIDITTSRLAATEIHTPRVVLGMLGALALIAALLGGYDLAAGRSAKPLYMVAYAAVVTFTILVIFDFEYPRLGFIRSDPIDAVLGGLRTGMR